MTYLTYILAFGATTLWLLSAIAIIFVTYYRLADDVTGFIVYRILTKQKDIPYGEKNQAALAVYGAQQQDKSFWVSLFVYPIMFAITLSAHGASILYFSTIEGWLPPFGQAVVATAQVMLLTGSFFQVLLNAGALIFYIVTEMNEGFDDELPRHIFFIGLVVWNGLLYGLISLLKWFF